MMSAISNIFPQVSDPRLDPCVERWTKFLTSLRSDTRVGIVYHGDLDGLIGAACTRTLLHRRVDAGNISCFWVSTEEYDFGGLRDWLATQSLDACVFMDVSVENHAPTMRWLNDNVTGSAFVYDHHITQLAADSYEKIDVANPTPSKLHAGESPLPTFAFACKLADEAGVQFPKWLLLTAIFTEGVESYFRDTVSGLFVSELRRPAGRDLRMAYRRSPLSKLSSLIRAEFSSSSKGHLALSVVEHAMTGEIGSLGEFQAVLSAELQPLADAISNEIARLVDELDRQIRSGDLGDRPVLLISVESPYSIAGPVASILRGKHPNRVIATYARHGALAVFEFRTRNDTHLNFPLILNRVASRVELVNFGGHPSAAGASLAYGSVEEFTKVFTEEVAADW